ncbi:MAG: ATP-binding protein [Ekhidna sp.]
MGRISFLDLFMGAFFTFSQQATMVMRSLTLLSFIIIPFLSFTQDFEYWYDSADNNVRNFKIANPAIEQALLLVERKDSARWIRALQLKNEIDFFDGSSGSFLAIRTDTIVRLASRIKDFAFACKSYIDQGYYYRRTDDNYQKAEESYHKALDLASANDLPQSIADANNALGVANFYRGNHREALEYYKAALQQYLKVNDSARMSKSYNNIAIIFKNQKNYPKAIEYYLESIRIFRKAGKNSDPRILANRLTNLAMAYQEVDAFEESEKAILEVIEIDRTHSKFDDFLFTHVLLIENHNKQGLFREAIDLSYQMEAKSDSISHDVLKWIFQIRRGWVYQDHAMNDSALYWYDQAIGIIGKDGSGEDYEYYKNRGEVLVALGKYREAIQSTQKGLEIALDVGVKNWIVQLYGLLYKSYKGLNQHENALLNHELYRSYQDSLWTEDKSIEIGLMQNEFELLEVEAKNQLLASETALQQQKIRSQNFIIISIGTIVVLLFSIALILRKQLIIRKELLLKIEGQSAKLKELDQAKTRFFANISHDLRSPLTLILGSLDKITERDYDILDKESKELLRLGIKNGKRLLYLADEIMDLTRLEEGKITLELQYVKIVPYLRLLTKMFSSAADIKSIELKFTTHAEDETTLQIDPHQFEKIIYNLLSNAIKFTPENGAVDVQVNTDKQHLEIVISDSGPGIPKESLNLIFDRYYQSSATTTSQAGVGIGLALVKELVELHGGTINASSAENGSVFTIRFPFKKSDWISKAIIPERSLDVITRNSLWMDLQEEKDRLQVPGIKNTDSEAQAVLIVEDHKELRSYLQSILNTDFRIYLAANGASALDILQSEKIDLIITDLMMPYMDGFELVDQLKNDKELKKIPIVVVSARTDRKEKLDLISKGAEDVISKPFDKDELMIKIQHIMQRDWDSSKTLSKLYGESAEEFEKNIMSRLENLIIKRIDDPHLSVLDLADEMAASERKVYRMIKKISGLTPYELIKEVRWQFLENYLTNNKVRTATEAAQIIGMNNVSSFSTQYKKRFGHSFKDVLAS